MQLTLRIVAICLMGMGVTWILQGVNILPGSFMTGQMVWAYRGAATAVVGLILLLFTLRCRKNP
jgi:leucyl aminopeptidase